MRPLDRVGSIKLKLGLVIVAAVAVTVVVIEVGQWAAWPRGVVALSAMAVALGLVQVLARGMTLPLRQMAREATRLAAGESHHPVVATSRDEVGALARAFNAMAEEIARTDQLRRDLVANVSHELRTPLAALRAVLENLADGIEEPDPATLQRLVRQSERLQALVEALLDLSRLEAGVVHLDVRDLVVRDLVGEAVELVSAGPGADVRVHVHPLDLAVRGDERRLVQVLVNLLDNARAHAPTGSDIEVVADRDDGTVVLAVIDQGPGVAAEDAERVFERFRRGPVAATEGPAAHDGGTGLGLAITRWLVELHGGHVRIDTTQQVGCRMVVSLPDTAGTP